MECASRFLALSALVLACESSRTDPAELHGVFDRPVASASASAAVPPASKTARGAAAPSAPSLSPPVRTPPAGPCLAPSGAPAPPDGRPAGRPRCLGARVLEARDGAGLPRYACVYAPADVDRRAPLPLVVFFHAENDSPAAVQKRTRLRKLVGGFDMTGEPPRQGFVLLAPQARRLPAGVAFDVEHVAADNADVLATEGFVEVLAREGSVDARRIYAVGESRAARMAALYAGARPERIAAVGAVMGEASEPRWSCAPPAPPVVVLYRACDSVAPCERVEAWLAARRAAGEPTTALRLGAGDDEDPSCVTSAARCPPEAGAAGHARWPTGREVDLLEGLARFSLAVPR
jgi:poly(3-hydroxybutyrate) depolymerase